MSNAPFTIPPRSLISTYEDAVPLYMRPNNQPQAVVFEGILTDEQINTILDGQMGQIPYRHDSCHATTRECKLYSYQNDLKPIYNIADMTNRLFFDFDLDEQPVSWLQTYATGEDYPTHSDGSPGQSRKMTAVALLTDPAEYFGGILEVDAFEEWYSVPQTKGTVVVFAGWVRHRVTPLHSGTRQTINMGFWGPPFR
jgi:predicted 2-oxoglutarate/Fe(II)-dependent dioxygenase YbiX